MIGAATKKNKGFRVAQRLTAHYMIAYLTKYPRSEKYLPHFVFQACAMQFMINWMMTDSSLLVRA